jgi:hypothetical protein
MDDLFGLLGFDEFWKIYPRHVAKKAAERAYRRAVKSATAVDILHGAMRYAAERTGQDGQFTKHPATWLNGGCWDDEPTRKADDAGNPIGAAFDKIGDCGAGRPFAGGDEARHHEERREPAGQAAARFFPTRKAG